MVFTLLGTGTSQGVPIIGCQCETCISDDPHDKRLRASALIQSQLSSVLIDCGPDFRQQMLRENVDRLDAVLITHEHNDHIIGLDDLRPLIFRNRKAMKIYAEARILNEIRERFAYAFQYQAYPGAPAFDLIPILPGDDIKIGDIQVKAHRAMHGPLPILGYSVANKIAYFTDTNEIPPETLSKMNKTPVLILDMLREKKHHSHNSLEGAIKLAHKVNAGQTYFIHMSHMMGPAKKWSQTLPPNIYASYDGLSFEI
ncbi:MAG: phosphoribosyl 1,2-cyclic phosphate phosphodiesterase [Saprospiraceae bacterium]|jgi:phosphoribosyl 1,2-cyclic phosphate phosphodiesterase